MRNKIKWVRACFWIGAIFDALVIIPMLLPKIGGAIFGIANFQPGVEYRYAMASAAALMAGWTCLLIWAARKPLEHKGILLLTLFPVLSGLVVAEIYAVAKDFISMEKMLPTWIIQVLLAALFSYVYWTVRRDRS